jgi:glycine/sarcosine N-methyltransferase
VRAFYDGLAATFDSIYADWDASVQRQGAALHRLVTARLGSGQHRVLDCACGIGTQTLGLLQQGHAVVGSDLSPVAVRRAAQLITQHNRNAALAAADMQRLPFRSVAFDAVVCADNSVPHLLTEAALRTALAEMARVTRSGGALLVSLRDYQDALDTHPTSRPPSVSGRPGDRTITFQLWHWHDDGVHYDVELFQLLEGGTAWTVSHWTTPSWAMSRTVLEHAVAASGWTELTWQEPADSGFFQPVLLAGKP